MSRSVIVFLLIAQARYSVSDVRSISDAVLDNVTGASRKWGGAAASGRKVMIDSRRLFGAFGHDADREGLTISAARGRHAPDEAPVNLLTDCSEAVRSACGSLRNGLLLRIDQPRSMPGFLGRIVVSVRLTYAISARDAEAGVPTFLAHSGFDALLERGSDGAWRLLRIEKWWAS